MQKYFLTYHIYSGKPYVINNYKYRIPDKALLEIANQIKDKSLIHSGDIYNAYSMDDERERITNYLKNFGFYSFSKEYIYYEVDSSLNNKQMNVSLVIKDPQYRLPGNQDSLYTSTHKQYKLGSIYINPDLDLQNPGKILSDTMPIKVEQGLDTIETNMYYFLKDGKMRIKPNTVTQSVLLKEGDYFSSDALQKTYRRLSALSVFKYSNIVFTERTENGVNLLDTRVDLARSKVQSYKIETEGTYSAGAPGLGANLVYSNKNIFRGAEIFQISLKGAGEAQKIKNELEDDAKNQLENAFTQLKQLIKNNGGKIKSIG